MKELSLKSRRERHSPAFFPFVSPCGERRLAAEVERGGDGRRDWNAAAAGQNDESAVAAILGLLPDL